MKTRRDILKLLGIGIAAPVAAVKAANTHKPFTASHWATHPAPKDGDAWVHYANVPKVNVASEGGLDQETIDTGGLTAREMWEQGYRADPAGIADYWQRKMEDYQPTYYDLETMTERQLAEMDARDLYASERLQKALLDAICKNEELAEHFKLMSTMAEETRSAMDDECRRHLQLVAKDIFYKTINYHGLPCDGEIAAKAMRMLRWEVNPGAKTPPRLWVRTPHEEMSLNTYLKTTKTRDPGHPEWTFAETQRRATAGEKRALDYLPKAAEKLLKRG